jgi:hypothetical protein
LDSADRHDADQKAEHEPQQRQGMSQSKQHD